MRERFEEILGWLVDAYRVLVRWLSEASVWALAHCQAFLLFYFGNVAWGFLVLLNDGGTSDLTPAHIAHTMLLDWLLASLHLSSRAATVIVDVTTGVVYCLLFGLSVGAQRTLAVRRMRKEIDEEIEMRREARARMEGASFSRIDRGVSFNMIMYNSYFGRGREDEMSLKELSRTIARQLQQARKATYGVGERVALLTLGVVRYAAPVLVGMNFAMLFRYGGLGATAGWLHAMADGSVVGLIVAAMLYGALTVWERSR